MRCSEASVAVSVAVRGTLAAIVLAVLLAVPAATLASSPSPTTAAAGDPRSTGQGPGLVGDPLTAIVLVLSIAAVSLGATLLYVRATGGSAGRRPS